MKNILQLVLGKYDFPVIYDSHFGHLQDNTIHNIEMGLNIEINIT